MRRLAGGTGGYYRGDERDRPSFGVLPSNRVAVTHLDPRGEFETGVEFDLHGHRAFAVQYISHRTSRGLRTNGLLNRALTRIDATYNLVQLRTPVVPAMVIAPVGVSTNPAAEFRTTRNRAGELRLADLLAEVDWLDDLIGHFTVRAADPDAARELLTPEAQRAILGDPWCQVRTITFEHGAIWTVQSGWLKEPAALDNARHLARIADAIPAEAWDYPSAGTT